MLTNTYNPDARIATQKNAAGVTKTNTYDNTNKLITQTDNNARTVKTTYDAKSRILQQTDPLGKNMVYTYSTEAVPLTQTDKNGNKTTFTYDSAGNLLSTTFPDSKSINYAYDSNNRITKLLDNRYGSTPRQTDYTYDSKGNLLQSAEAGITTKYTYDATGEMLTFTDPLNNILTWTRNTLGNILSEKNSLNNTTTFEYDAIGRFTKSTDAEGKQFSQTYDGNSNILTITNSAGTTTNYYDKENRLIKVKLPNNYITQLTYNSTGSLISVTDPLNSITTYGYDIYQNLITQKDALNRTISYTYDQLNRQTQEKTALTRIFKWEYDANGNVTKRTDALNRATTYQYDAFNRLKKITYPDAKTVTYEYDARGNRTKMTDPVGTSTYVYDNFDRMTQASNPYGHVIKYEYDNTGNLKKLIYPDNKAVTYTYDSNNQLISVTDWNNKTTTYSYYKNGTLATRVYPNTISTKYTYDNANRLIDIEHKKGTTVAAKFSYVRDALGNITQANPTGSFFTIPSPTNYTYDALGRILSAISEDREGKSIYTYDKVGNILTKKRDSTTTTYTYDTENKLTKVGSLNYTYDLNGNLTRKYINSFISISLAYNFDNQLTKYGGATFKYDGEGTRLESSKDRLRYVTDMSTPLPRVIAEVDSQFADIENWYVYGVGLISEGDENNIFRDYYIEDGLGNTRYLTDDDGTTGSINFYDPFGNIAWHSGGSPRFRFSGQQEDKNLDQLTSLYYMRARYYDPTIGRFITKDPDRGILTNPQTQNPYTYSLNNPVNLSDPSGKCLQTLCTAELISLGTTLTAGAPVIVTLADYIAQDIKKGDYLGAVDKATLLIPGGVVESSILKFGSRTLLLDHFRKHGARLGFKTISEYLNGARNLFKGGKGIQTFTRSNGEKMFFNPLTGEFGVLGSDGKTIKTFFKPEGNPLDYWLNKSGRN